MELLGPALTDLEKAGRVLGSLDNHYVGQVYPQFKDDFKNLEIPDIDNYETYNLKNVEDDLKHIQSVLCGSPSKYQFSKKIEFLVQLSQKTIEIVTKAPKQDKTATKKPLPSTKPKKISPIKVVVAESPKEVIEPVKLPLLPPIMRELDEKSEIKKMGKIKPINPKKKRTAKNNENIKKKIALYEGKTLSKISEETANEEVSELDISQVSKVGEVTETDWSLTPSQQERVSNTLKKYNMSEDVWKNYILSRVHGDAQLRRMGIHLPQGKVDCQIETIKFVEELERHMDRKNKVLTKRHPSNTLTPLQPDQDPQILDLVSQNFFNAPGPQDFSTQPILGKILSSSGISSTVSIGEPDDEIKLFSLPIVQPLKPKPENMSSDTDLMSRVDALSRTPTTIAPSKNDTLPSKMWNLASTHTSHLSSKHATLQADYVDSLTNIMDLKDSLQESLNMDQVSTFHYMKSQGHFRLPSISSSASHIKRFSTGESPLSHRIVTGRKYRPHTDQSSRTITDFALDKNTECSIEDSLDGDSLVVNKNRPAPLKRPFRISSVGTVRSKYLTSFGETGSLNKMSIKESDHTVSISKDSLKIPRKPSKSKVEGELTGLDVRTEPSQLESLMVSDSLNERTSIKTSSERTMMTVMSQDDNTKLALSRASSQIVKIAEMTEIEYCGEVKRQCLLGSGSEAKVFLCKIKDYEEELALKQYDLVKNQKRNGEAYDGLIKEFDMLKHLDHENIIKYICLYKPKTTTYHNCLEFGIIMEYMPGGSLDTYIEETAHYMTLKTKKELMKQILSGIDFLHQHNIIHRDLKPGNILLSQDKTLVKISDFGISKKTDTDTSTKRTLVGTPWYMAPEVISQEGYSSKADIWSAGCCFFHLITGQKPYHNANAIQALLLMVNHQSPLETCPPEILDKINEYEGIKEFLELCFNRNKAQRPTASSLLRHPIFEGI